MTDRKPPRDPLMPPPIPQRRDTERRDTERPASDRPTTERPAPPPQLNTVRPGVDRPEDRLRTTGRGATRPSQTGLPVRPPYDPNQPPTGRTSRREPTPKRSGLGFALLTGLLVVLALAGSAAAYFAYAPPIELIKQQAIAQIKAKTGRDLIISGETRFALLPALTLTMKNVSLSAPPGMPGAAFVTVAELDASVRLWPLLQRQISVDQLILKQPVFDLRVDGSGKRSWDFAGLTAPLPIQYAQAAAPTTPKGTASDLPDAVRDFVDNASDPANPSPQLKARMARLDELTLSDVRIDGGSIIYADARTGAQQQVTGLDARIGLTSLASPLDATGALIYEGQSVGFDVKLASPKALLEARPAKLALAVKGAPIDARYDGTLTVRTGLDLDGDVTAKAASLRALLLWLGHEMPPADGFGPTTVTGKFKATGATYTLSNATFGLDGATASGVLLLDTGGARPRVNANLKISELDLNRYTLEAGKAASAKPKAAIKREAPPAASAGPTVNPAAKSIEDLINGAGGPQVKGYVRRTGWSTDPIALTALGMVDADAKLQIGKLQYRELKAGATSVSIALKNKALRANFDEIQLYEGRGRGLLTIDANPAVPVIGANVSIDGVAAQPLLKDAADFELLAGTARLTIAIGAQGSSEAQLVSTANGKADFAFANGAIVGYNIPGAIRGVTQGKFSGFNKVAAEKTDFSELSASFAVANGIATNQDLRLIGPLMRVTGAGQFRLPDQSLDYTIKPKVVASLQGQGATDALAGLEVPVRFTGPWANPQIAPDLNGLLKDPNKAIDAVKEIGKQFKDSGQAKEIGAALKGLLGKGGADGGEGQGGATNKAKDLLNKLFKKTAPAPQAPATAPAPEPAQ